MGGTESDGGAIRQAWRALVGWMEMTLYRRLLITAARLDAWSTPTLMQHTHTHTHTHILNSVDRYRFNIIATIVDRGVRGMSGEVAGTLLSGRDDVWNSR
jgi:hypothetical protein